MSSRRGQGGKRRAAGPALAAALLAVLGLSGCVQPVSAGSGGRPVVLTTFTVLADMTRVVAGDRVVVRSLTKPGVEIHDYELTPGDLRGIDDADLVLDNGFGLERWFERFTERLEVPHVTLTEGIRPTTIGGGGDYAGTPNPHAWMSPTDAKTYVENIRAALTDLDPAGAATYRDNAAAYTAQLDRVRASVARALGSVPAGRRALVTCEGAFSYLARDLGLVEQYLWPVNAEREGTPQQVADTVAFVRERQVPAVFCESTVDDDAQQQVAREAGSRVGGTLYVDSLSPPDGPVPTFLDLLEHDVETIVAGLSGSAL